jgi:hypothetical protein
MACQSLDNDEILNVRWATEDPNPVQKVAEHQRLEEMGREAIQARMDPRIIDAMRAVRALEDGDVLDENGDLQDQDGVQDEDDEDDDNDEPRAKRRRIEQPESPPSEQEQPPPPPNGLLSADTLEGLKYFAEIRKRNGGATAVTRKAPPPPPTGLGLADYGSDED